MLDNIHPLIQDLSISHKVKINFQTKKYYEMIQAPLTLSAGEDQFDEATTNWWSFNPKFGEASVSKLDVKLLFEAIIDERSKFLKQYYPGTKMTFYVWYDSMSGNLNFSLINYEKKLPFECSILITKSLEEIIQEYIEDPYKGSIPKSELDSAEAVEANHDPVEGQYIQNIWAIKIP